MDSQFQTLQINGNHRVVTVEGKCVSSVAGLELLSRWGGSRQVLLGQSPLYMWTTQKVRSQEFAMRRVGRGIN